MLPRDAIAAILRHEEIRPIPCTLGYEEEVGARVDAHYGSRDWRDRLPRYIAGAGNLDTDRKKPTADPAFWTDPYGSLWRMDRRPYHLEKPGLSRPSMAGYAFPKPEDFFHSPEQCRQAIQWARDARRESFVVGQTGWGLFERSWTIRGFENILVDMVEEEAFMEELLDRLTDLYLAFVEHVSQLPLDGILFGDDWGDQRGVIMGPALWRKWYKPRWAKIFAAAKSRGLAVMCHSCGSVVDILPDLIDIGLDVLESVQPEAEGMDPIALKKCFGQNLAFWGGVGTQRLLPLGTPAEIHAEVARLAREGGKGGGFILAAAKPLQPETPTANAVAFVEALLARE